jgi:hypothetical protein
MPKNDYPLYLDGFLKDKHVWSEEKELEEYSDGDDKFIARVCTICGAINRGYGPQYDSCRVTTDYPGDDGPCLCTGHHYAEAHGLEYASGKVYGYTKKAEYEKITGN